VFFFAIIIFSTQKVIIVGHNYESIEQNKLVPLYTEGKVNLIWNNVYGFVKTNGICPMGVCGGPVLQHAHSQDGKINFFAKKKDGKRQREKERKKNIFINFQEVLKKEKKQRNPKKRDQEINPY
jgi:hypothetical protein